MAPTFHHVAADGSTARVEYRAEGDAPVLGMFVPFDSPSVDLGGFTESNAPGAFKRTIQNGARSKGNGHAPEKSQNPYSLYNTIMTSTDIEARTEALDGLKKAVPRRSWANGSWTPGWGISSC